jgi:type VI secretion system secreted protein Hcp
VDVGVIPGRVRGSAAGRKRSLGIFVQLTRITLGRDWWSCKHGPRTASTIALTGRSDLTSVPFMNRKLRPSAFSRTLALVPPAVALVAQQAGADIFLKIETGGTPSTIAGESLDKAHSGWIEASSFSFGASNTPSLSGGLISGTKGVATALIISKSLDKASPSLFLGCAQGTIYPTVTMELQQSSAGTTPVVYYRITLNNVLVSKLDTSGVADARPSEEVSFSYQKIKVEYYTVDQYGKAILLPAVSWDFVNNK